MSNSIHNSISKAGGANTYPANGKGSCEMQFRLRRPAYPPLDRVRRGTGAKLYCQL